MNLPKSHFRGQTTSIVILFMIFFSLAGTTWHLYYLQEQTKETAKKGLKEQENSLRRVKDSIDALEQKISSIKEDLYTQQDKTSKLEKDSMSVKESVDGIKAGIQSQIKNEISTLSTSNKKDQENAQASLSKVEAELETLKKQLSQIKTEQDKQNIPVIDVKLEAVTPDVKKPKK
jgi:chromosome segregation ATPase